MSDIPEKEVMPGVYITDFREKTPEEKYRSIMSRVNDPDSIAEDIKATIAELENSLGHLKRSNEELRIAYETDPDEIYIESIKENEQAIIKRTNQLKELEDQLIHVHSV